ncbi:MAG: MFS transporter [Austwickia sp.]|jgi:MHS family alpha-ketoglutarate permease-like MFS transporter|nr:MAG: MFS transporter [Austwickia sp.]
MSSTPTSDHGHRPGHARRTLLGTGVGNMLEWYDWNVYATFAVYMSKQLFDASNETSALLQTLAVFAVGFVARPFGGAFFGWLADRIGRKHSLMVAVICASIGSLIIAVCPTYAQAGAWASLLLLVARLIQGLAHGGELPSAQTYLSEQAPRKERGFWSSAIYVTGTLGLLLGLALGKGLEANLNSAAMASYGWRIPFFLGAVLGVFALWIRNRMEESEVFEDAQEHTDVARENVFVSAARHWRTGLQVIGMTMGLTITYYVWSVAMQPYAVKTLKFSQGDGFTASIIGNIVFVLCLPVWGKISDRIGRKPLMLVAMLGSAIMYIPMLNLIQNQMWQLALAISVMCILLGAYLAIAPAVYAELFPTNVRATAFGIPYAITIAAFGGTASYVQTWMSDAFPGNKYAFAIYAIIACCISALTVFTLPETKAKDLHEVDQPLGAGTAAPR